MITTWKKILFIFNPVAGRSQIRNYLLDIIETLSAADYEVVCYPTTKQGDARRIARERMGDYLYVVCAGGDGTLDEVVSGMMENPDKPFVPVGYIPAGTTNDFASSLRIPTDMVQAARVVASGRTFRCDLGQFNESDYFTYVAAFGLFTGTSYQTPQELKNQLGHFAYILQGLSELGQMHAYQMHVRALVPRDEDVPADYVVKKPGTEKPKGLPAEDPPTDQLPVENTVPENPTQEDLASQDLPADDHDGKWIEFDGEFALGLITNSRSIGGFQNITGQQVDLQDGLFEVTLVRMPKNPLEVSEILMSISNPDMHSSMVESFKTSRITLTCDEQIAWTRDGEYGGSHKEVDLRICPGQLRILVPEQYAEQPEIVG